MTPNQKKRKTKKKKITEPVSRCLVIGRQRAVVRREPRIETDRRRVGRVILARRDARRRTWSFSTRLTVEGEEDEDVTLASRGEAAKR